jgi:hypothetical protein
MLSADGRYVSSILTVILVGWFLLVLAAGFAGAFESGPSRPPLAVLVAVAGPPLIFAAAYRGSRRFRNFVLGIDLRLLTAVQSWRVVGVMFLAFYAFGLLPGLFAWPAGIGDAAVGLAAPFVLLAMLRRSATWRRQVLWLNIAGLLDFIGAVGTGALSSNSSIGLVAHGTTHVSLGSLPLSLIPTFAVPLWTLFHIVSLLQLARTAGTVSAREATVAAAAI